MVQQVVIVPSALQESSGDNEQRDLIFLGYRTEDLGFPLPALPVSPGEGNGGVTSPRKPANGPSRATLGHFSTIRANTTTDTVSKDQRGLSVIMKMNLEMKKEKEKIDNR